MLTGSRSYAGFWRRLFASLIDTVFFLVLLLVIFALLGKSIGDSVLAPQGGIDLFLNNILPILLTVYFWHRFGGTPGKLLLDCHVVDIKTGKPPSWSQSIIRYVGYFLSMIPFLLGFFWVIWDKRKQGFHDKLAKTVVLTGVSQDEDDESQKKLEQLMEEAG